MLLMLGLAPLFPGFRRNRKALMLMMLGLVPLFWGAG